MIKKRGLGSDATRSFESSQWNNEGSSLRLGREGADGGWREGEERRRWSFESERQQEEEEEASQSSWRWRDRNLLGPDLHSSDATNSPFSRDRVTKERVGKKNASRSPKKI